VALLQLLFLPTMRTRNVSRPSHTDLIAWLQNSSEVLREGVRLLERQHTEETAKLAALRGAARIGIADIEAGHFVEFGTAEDLSNNLARQIDTVLSDPSIASSTHGRLSPW